MKKRKRKSLKKVGKYKKEFNKNLGIKLPCQNIYQSEGLKKHVKKRHPGCVCYIDKIPQIIKKPDFIGINPSEQNSIELIKKYNENILVGIKLDKEKGYFYVASLYSVKDSKVERRLNSGRLKIFKKNLDNKNN